MRHVGYIPLLTTKQPSLQTFAFNSGKGLCSGVEAITLSRQEHEILEAKHDHDQCSDGSRILCEVEPKHKNATWRCSEPTCY